MVKKVLMFILPFLLFPVISFASSNVTFGWDKNIEPDLAGYKLYQGTTSGNYTSTTDIPLTALTDPENPEFMITVPIDGTYFWALTAYDQNNNESGYSNEVTATLDSTAPGNPTTFVIKIIIVVQ